MMRLPSSLSTIARVNFKLLGAALFGGLGWWLWLHANALWWQLYLLGSICILGALGMFGQALRAMIKLYVRDKALAQYMAQGRQASSSSLASPDHLDQAGMR